MIDLVVVLRAEDAVLDFLSVLASPTSPGSERPTETHVLLCDTGERLVLPPGADPAERLGLLARHVRPADDSAASPGVTRLTDWLGDAVRDRTARIWTHSPADNRRSRGRTGLDAAEAADALGLPVLHAVGYSPFLQFISDRDHPLDRTSVAAKLNFTNQSCAHLLDSESPDHMLYTGRVPATERFFASGADERLRLYALLASLDDEAAAVPDPWEFASSPYESERLDTTTAWIAHWCEPDAGPLVEVGACEGALTGRLADKGFRVEATEPNPAFRRRLVERVAHERLTVHNDDLEALAVPARQLAGSAYLLIEMLYYGQDLALLDSLPTDLVFVALEPEALDTRLRPWLAETQRWRQADETVLVEPALETVCGGRAYLRKRGSTGILLRRVPGIIGSVDAPAAPASDSAQH
ncbi:hypothetical protein [Streptomyces sp. NPDC050504]|uniref:hypothetical protein n=1 Tax=Streptomyces sp. NPDC050504 TaxID=3365618 RepID=UPI00379CD5D9